SHFADSPKPVVRYHFRKARGSGSPPWRALSRSLFLKSFRRSILILAEAGREGERIGGPLRWLIHRGLETLEHIVVPGNEQVVHPDGIGVRHASSKIFADDALL